MQIHSEVNYSYNTGLMTPAVNAVAPTGSAPSGSAETAIATPQAASVASPAASSLLDTQTLVALFNAQEGGQDMNLTAPSEASMQMKAFDALLGQQTGGALSSHPAFQPASPGEAIPPQHDFINPATTRETIGIVSSAGTLNPSQLQGQTAAGLAGDLINEFGSNGSLSLSDVDGALGISNSTDPSVEVQQMKSQMASVWDQLTGGASSLSAAQLTADIRSKLGAS
jgi:hypothetical protein